MRYVIGRLWVRPGTRDELMEQAKAYVAASRADRGCVYFHMEPMREDANGVVMIECWTDQAAHQAHQDSAYAAAFNPIAGQYVSRGEFQEMNVENPDVVVF